MALSLRELIGNQTAVAAQSLRRGGSVVAAVAVACALVAAALGCAIAALWLAVSPIFGPALAALTSAVVLLLLAGVALYLARRLQLRSVGQPATLSIDDMSRAFSADKTSWLSAALVAGLVAGGRQN